MSCHIFEKRNVTMQKLLSGKKALLPWNATPVLMFANLEDYFVTQLPASVTRYLPASVTLFSDLEIDDVTIMEFLSNTTEFLAGEINRRSLRCERLIKSGLFTREEIECFLTARRHTQPWAIYYSKSGGLGPLGQDSNLAHRQSGVIPCSSVKNHGVAWKFTDDDGLKVWLATAKKMGHDWHLDSDIGHESAHAAFAPIPLFAQEAHLNADGAKFSRVQRVEDLDAGHFGSLAYLYSEIAVVAVRGEQRPTQTGLPVRERNELLALLEVSHQLMPRVGFDRALSARAGINDSIDLENGQEIFELAAPVIRILPYLTRLATFFKPPTLDWYRTVGKSATK